MPTAVTDGPMVDLHEFVGRGLPAAAVGVGNVYGERRTKCLCVGNNVVVRLTIRFSFTHGHLPQHVYKP